MFRKLFVIFATFVAISEQAVPLKKCNDCMLLTNCPAAVYLAVNKKTTRTEGFIKDALCSAEKDNGIPKVCCSEFPPSPSEIENHPNLSLLPQDCGLILGDRIVGGSKAKLFEFPWMTLISYKTRNGYEFLCGGTLINSHYILTAAHCIEQQRIAGVRLGEHDYLKKEECDNNACPVQDVLVEETIIHQSYTKVPIVRNDIALLRLKKSAKLDRRNIKPICLPVTQQLREHNLDNEMVTIAGWGLTENQTSSSTLLKVELPMYSREDCKQYYNKNLKQDTTKNILCAGEPGKDSCKGDSGGPLMLESQLNGKYRYIQYGVVSHGPTKCGSEYPAVYTDVSWFMKWILDTIKP